MDNAIFNAGGLAEGLVIALRITGPIQGMTLQEIVVEMLIRILNLVSLAATVMIIVAGIVLIVSGGSEGMRDRAKRIVVYTVIGLCLVLFARVVVGFLTTFLV
jgi:hypothetical protein